ncbi:glycosyltransferase family 25 protein [Nitratireductor rhodophyticola]|uniref:glycosyltransferase family 25 protein n=1 Tax=Nitratireductor rhodophyticola TaxID=2854036 RepID=UPI002AC95E36|nr:glycosyltransferase family 25 protein [Nitratireductor rhodophyticola]WPZ12914.1 glycosyltransferase family 25 protein [Nitratireductor rhodophyticola]
MKIYAMNLQGAQKRLKTLSSRFDAAGLSFKRVEGIDGRLLDQSEIDRVVKKSGRWGRLTPGEVGCFLSHRACWKTLIGDGGRYGAIFEDDVLLGENAGAILGSSDWIPEAADIVKLEATASRVYLDLAEGAVVSGRKVQRLRSSHYCAAGYIVSRDCAQRLLAESETFCEAVDDFLFSALSPVFTSSKIYQLSPAVCIQEWGAVGDGQTHDPATSIEGRESKTEARLPFAMRLSEVCAKETKALINKTLSAAGVRQRQQVEFR